MRTVMGSKFLAGLAMVGVIAATIVIAATMSSAPARADVRNEAQDAMLGAEGTGPRDRFTSLWHVECGQAQSGRRCEVTLQTADRESKNYTQALRYPIRFVVDGGGWYVEFPVGSSMPPDQRVDLVLDETPLVSVRAGDRISDPALLERLTHGRQLLISSGSFAQGPRLRSYIMLDGLGMALGDAERMAGRLR